MVLMLIKPYDIAVLYVTINHIKKAIRIKSISIRIMPSLIKLPGKNGIRRQLQCGTFEAMEPPAYCRNQYQSLSAK